DDVIAHLLKRTRYFFLLGIGLYVALHTLDFSGRGADLVGRIVFVLLILQAAIWANSVIGLWIDRYREQKLETDAAAVTSMQALGFLGRLVVWFMALLVVLGNLGVEIAPLVAGAGIGGIAIALAVQNILGDLFASLSIVLDKPFVIGDALAVGTETGTVEHIGLKTTRLRSVSGEQIIFSNGDLLNSRIRNFKRMYERRVVFTLGVTYDTPRDKLEQIPAWIREIVEREDYVRFDRAHWKSFGDSALNYEIVYYVLGPEYNIYMDIQQRINLAIFSRFEDEGVSFAYPTQTLIVQRTDADGRTGFLE
ncbi:MAG TPA: mechanosensitive ion channel family protein, partial [Rhodothermales bacterium]